MPHATPVGKTYDSGDFATVLDAALQADGLRRLRRPTRGGRAARQAARHRPGLLSGSHRGDPTERAEIRFAEDGFVDVYVGTQSTGQGHETAYVQLTVAAPRHRRREDPHPPGRHRHHPGRRRHRRSAQPVFRGPGHPGHRRHGDRQGQAGGGRSAGGRAGRYRFRRRPVLHRRHRPRHRHHRRWPRRSGRRPLPASRPTHAGRGRGGE